MTKNIFLNIFFPGQNKLFSTQSIFFIDQNIFYFHQNLLFLIENLCSDTYPGTFFSLIKCYHLDTYLFSTPKISSVYKYQSILNPEIFQHWLFPNNLL